MSGRCYYKNMKHLIANIPGSAAYLFLLLGWMWAIVLIVTNTRLIESLTRDKNANQYQTTIVPEFSLPEPLVAFFVIAITAFMIGLTIYASFKAPKEAVRQTSRATRKTAVKLTPLLAKTEQPIEQPKAKKKLLTAKLIVYIKLSLAILPVLATVLIATLHNRLNLDPNLAVATSAAISFTAVIFFAAQYGLARLFKIPAEKLL